MHLSLPLSLSLYIYIHRVVQTISLPTYHVEVLWFVQIMRLRRYALLSDVSVYYMEVGGILLNIVYTSRFARVILAQGPGYSSLHRSNLNG